MTTGIEIPGTFIATVAENGVIISYTFLPAEGSAGYFGPGATDIETGEAVDPDPGGSVLDGSDRHYRRRRIVIVPVLWEG